MGISWTFSYKDNYCKSTDLEHATQTSVVLVQNGLLNGVTKAGSSPHALCSCVLWPAMHTSFLCSPLRMSSLSHISSTAKVPTKPRNHRPYPTPAPDRRRPASLPTAPMHPATFGIGRTDISSHWPVPYWSVGSWRAGVSQISPDNCEVYRFGFWF